MHLTEDQCAELLAKYMGDKYGDWRASTVLSNQSLFDLIVDRMEDNNNFSFKYRDGALECFFTVDGRSYMTEPFSNRETRLEQICEGIIDTAVQIQLNIDASSASNFNETMLLASKSVNFGGLLKHNGVVSCAIVGLSSGRNIFNPFSDVKQLMELINTHSMSFEYGDGSVTVKSKGLEHTSTLPVEGDRDLFITAVVEMAAKIYLKEQNDSQ